MQLLQDLGRDEQRWKRMGLFLCPVCGEKVIRTKQDGKRNYTCGRGCRKAGFKNGVDKETRGKTIEMGNPYENLCNAIILQAVNDWIELKDHEEKDPMYYRPQIDYLEKWFLGPVFHRYTTMSGKDFLAWLKKAYEDHTLVKQKKWRRAH